MPHSLRSKLSWFRYKGIITNKDYQRLCKALDMEKAIEDIKGEIEEEVPTCCCDEEDHYYRAGLYTALEIIDKHMGKK